MTKLLFATVATIAIAAPAFAQEGAQEDRSLGLEEVVVTAQKRSENLQKVPIAVSAVTSESIASSGIRTAQDLTFGVPSLAVQANTAATIFYLRGVGTALGSPGLDSTIATFVDGVYIPSMSATTLSLNNLERIEVLKGPQGTLYGRNATGGAINIITRTPSRTPHVEGQVGYGNRNTIDADFYGTAGLGDKVAADLAVTYHNQMDGFGTNLFSGDDINKDKSVNVRSKVLFDVGPNTRLTVSGDYDKTNTSFGDAYRAIPSSNLLDGTIGYSGGYWDTNTDGQPLVTVMHAGGSAKLEHDMGAFSITNIFAYRYQKIFQEIDVDTTPIEIIQASLDSSDGQFTNEFQVNYTGPKLNAVGGVFYLDGYNKYDRFALRGAAVAPLDLLVNKVRQRTRSYAFFGQGTYSVLENTNVTLGLRYTHDKRDFTATQEGIIAGAAFDLVPPFTPDDPGQTTTFSKVTWRIAVDQKLSEQTMVYASYSRGFKSGVYNLSAPNDPVVQPETLDAYEIGLKSTVMGNRLRFNPAVFYYDYKNIQLSQVKGTSTQLFNAATARIYGADVDLTFAVTDALMVQAGAAYTHARYRAFRGAPITVPSPIPGAGNIVTSGDLINSPMVLVPEWTFNIAADYTVPLAQGELATNVSLVYNSGFFWAVDSRVKQEAFTLVNAQTKWSAPGNHYNIRLWARNVFNTKHLSTVNQNNTGDIGNPAPGRTFGVSVGFSL